jgi:septum formation protein
MGAATARAGPATATRLEFRLVIRPALLVDGPEPLDRPSPEFSGEKSRMIPKPVSAVSRPAVHRARPVRVAGIVPFVSSHSNSTTLILASRSPRRQTLLREAGYDFAVISPGVDEDDFPPTLLPAELALFLARVKARSVSERYPTHVVIGADTVVAFGDRVLGKPRDASDARRMLTLLAGATHVVITGVAVAHHSLHFAQERRVLSAVRIRPMSGSEIDRYVATGLWEGKAGGYGLQDGNAFIQGVAGCPTNVIGLPMSTTRLLLSAAGVQPARNIER